MMCLRRPWSEHKYRFSHLIMEAVESGQRPTIPDPMLKPSSQPGASYLRLMCRCWDQDERQRPLFNKIKFDLEDMAVQLHRRHTLLVPPKPHRVLSIGASFLANLGGTVGSAGIADPIPPSTSARDQQGDSSVSPSCAQPRLCGDKAIRCTGSARFPMGLDCAVPALAPSPRRKG